MLKINNFFVLILFLFLVYSKADSPIVKTSLGTILGTLKQSDEGRDYASFEGIPYAKPPVDDLRFKVS